MLKDASKGQRKSIELAQKVVRQQLAALKVEHGSNSLFKTLSAKFVGNKAATAATHPLSVQISPAAAAERIKVPEGEKLQAKDGGKGAWTKNPNFNAKGYWPLIGDKTGRKLTNLLTNPEDEAWKQLANFNQKGYWPLNGNENKLKKLGIPLCLSKKRTLIPLSLSLSLARALSLCWPLNGNEKNLKKLGMSLKSLSLSCSFSLPLSLYIHSITCNVIIY